MSVEYSMDALVTECNAPISLKAKPSMACGRFQPASFNRNLQAELTHPVFKNSQNHLLFSFPPMNTGREFLPVSHASPACCKTALQFLAKPFTK